MDHIPPVFGKSSIAYSAKKFNTEFFMQFNGWKKIKDYNPDGEDNGQYATVDGMPSWLTLNWRGSFAVKKYLTIQLLTADCLLPTATCRLPAAICP